MTLSKDTMLTYLPIREGDLTIRAWTRRDTDVRARWPSYPPQYAAFNFAQANAPKEELDRHFAARDRDSNRLDLAVDHKSQCVIGFVVLKDIDWSESKVRNIGIRIHPEWCDKGIGTFVLTCLARWCRECGMKLLRLDVGPANARAVRCYQKVGFVKAGEFWKSEQAPSNIDIHQKQYDDLRHYFRMKDGVAQVQFWWMELDLEKLK